MGSGNLGVGAGFISELWQDGNVGRDVCRRLGGGTPHA